MLKGFFVRQRAAIRWYCLDGRWEIAAISSRPFRISGPVAANTDGRLRDHSSGSRGVRSPRPGPRPLGGYFSRYFRRRAVRIMRVLPATRYGSWPGPSPNGQRCLAGVVLLFLAVAM